MIPTWGKEKSSTQKCWLVGNMLVLWRVVMPNDVLEKKSRLIYIAWLIVQRGNYFVQGAQTGKWEDEKHKSLELKFEIQPKNINSKKLLVCTFFLSKLSVDFKKPNPIITIHQLLKNFPTFSKTPQFKKIISNLEAVKRFVKRSNSVELDQRVVFFVTPDYSPKVSHSPWKVTIPKGE